MRRRRNGQVSSRTSSRITLAASSGTSSTPTRMGAAMYLKSCAEMLASTTTCCAATAAATTRTYRLRSAHAASPAARYDRYAHDAPRHNTQSHAGVSAASSQGSATRFSSIDSGRSENTHRSGKSVTSCGPT